MVLFLKTEKPMKRHLDLHFLEIRLTQDLMTELSEHAKFNMTFPVVVVVTWHQRFQNLDCLTLCLSPQVIKYKLCRCSDNKHKHNNNNDQGTVLSLDDVKCHVSNFH